MKKQIARSVFWIVWSRGGIQVLSFISTLFVARLLDPSDYGVMALAGIWTSSIALLAEMGLGAAIIQFRELEEWELNACFWLTMGFTTIGYLALYASAPSIAVWFNSPLLSTVLRVSGISLLLIGLRVVPDSLLRKRLALDKISQAEIVASVVTIPVVLVMAWAGAGIWALVAGVLIQPLVQNLVIFWVVSWWPGFRLGGNRIGEVLRYSTTTLGARMCWTVYQQTDTFVLGKVSGDIALGLYSMAKQLATLPVEKVAGMVNQIASPMMAALQDNRDTMRNYFTRSIRLVTGICFPLCIGLMLVANDLVLVALGEKWLSAAPVVKVLCVYGVFCSVSVLLFPVLMACNRVHFAFRYTLTQLLVMPAAAWVGATLNGAMGVAVAWALVYPLALIWLAGKVLKELKMAWHTLIFELLPATVATVVMGLTVVMVQGGLSYLWLDVAVVRMLLGIVAGITAYVFGLLWTKGPVLNEIVEVIGWVGWVKGTKRIFGSENV